MNRGGAELGRVVKKGRIRVDAKKAISKLRDHLLVDLHLYAIEVVRAAILGGASRVDVTFDADDVIIAFDGRSLEPAQLSQLFEHLTGGDDTEDARFLRLLALGVNAALGLSPAWISLATSNAGEALSVEWTPALLAAIERDEQPLPEPRKIALPKDMPETGTRFQFRRKVGWEVVRRVAARNPPREVVLLTEALVRPRIPLYVNGEPPAPPSRSEVLVRAPFSLAGGRTAHVEITRSFDLAMHADFCELGILLCRMGVAFGRHFPLAANLGVSPPVRLVVDTDALPTNASRSAVREDSPMLTSLARSSAGALSDAITAAIATLFGGDVPDGVTVTDDRAALEDALGAFLCCAVASLTARVALPEALRRVIDLPLFRDGLGRPMPYSKVPQADPLLVWSGKHPAPPEMEPWAHTILWLRDRVAERVIGARRIAEPQLLVERAKRGATRYQKLLASPEGRAAVPEDDYLCHSSFSFSEGPFAGLEGEVAISASLVTYVRNIGLRVFVQGRCFETFPIPEDAVPLPCLIALSWPGHIRPTFAYEGVEPSQGLSAAIAFAVRAAVLLCERYAKEREGRREPIQAAEAQVLRCALATAVIAPSKLYSVEGFRMPALAELPALVKTPSWSALNGQLVSLATLCEFAARTGAVCAVAPCTPGRAPDGRPVVQLIGNDAAYLRACLHPDIAIVRYDAALLPEQAPALHRSREQMKTFIHWVATESQAPIFRLVAPSCRYLATLGRSEVRVWHGNAELMTIATDPRLGGVAVAIDDDSIVPNDKWDAALYAADPALAMHAERGYANRLVAAILGDKRARNELFSASSARGDAPYAFPQDARELPIAVRRYLTERAAQGRATDSTAGDQALGLDIEQIPYLTMLDSNGDPAPACLTEVVWAHTSERTIPVLKELPRFRPFKWRPVIESDYVLLTALVRWQPNIWRDATSELGVQEERARQELEYTEFLKRPALDVSDPGPRADYEGPSVYLPSSQEHGASGIVAAFARKELELERALAELTYQGRLVGEEHFSDIPVPIVARVCTVTRASFEGMKRLSVLGRSEVAARLKDAARELSREALERASRPGSANALFEDVRALKLVLWVLEDPDGSESIKEALMSDSLLWPTVQAGPRPFKQLLQQGTEICTGKVLYSVWVVGSAASELDRPVLHVAPTPEGELLARILTQLGLSPRSVSDALAMLQAERSRGSIEKPRLAERPPHPALLRETTELVGEIGLFESGEATLLVQSLTGETTSIRIDLAVPVRGVHRTELFTTSTLAVASVSAKSEAMTLFETLIPLLGELPSFVRGHFRKLVGYAVAKGALSQLTMSRDASAPVSAAERPADQVDVLQLPDIAKLPKAMLKAPIYPDIDGGYWSIEQLATDKETDWSCTFDPPPYPKLRQAGRTLHLTREEHLQFYGKLRILNVTEWMRRDLEAERRREAPPAAEIQFDAEIAAHLLRSFSVQEGSLTGQIGLLRPEAHEHRGISVLFSRREVCTIKDGQGWPLACVLNDDKLHPDRWFSQITHSEERKLRRRARELATSYLQKTLLGELPKDRMTEVFLDEAVPPAKELGSTGDMHVTGYLALPTKWPISPSIRIYVQGFAGSFEQALSLSPALIATVLPITGVLFVAVEGVFTVGGGYRLALALRDKLTTTIEALLEQAPSDPEILAYAWNTALLGATLKSPLLASSSDGKRVAVDDVLAALERGEIWLTDRSGSADGAFPDGAPPFLLHDEPSPLVRVLRARAPQSKIKLLGGLEGAQGEQMLAPPSIPPPKPLDVVSIPPERPDGDRSWFSELVSRVTSLFAGASDNEHAPTGIGDAVERALRALRLRDEPVILVKETRRGRLLKYDKKNRVIAINVAHEALSRIVSPQASEAFRSACIVLVAMAISEVNIALDNVTDHDEAQAILELLRQEGAGAAARDAPGAAPERQEGSVV